MSRILIANENEGVLNTLMALLQSDEFDVMPTGEFGQALSAVQNTQFDVMVCDVSISGGRGIELMEQAQKAQPNLSIISIGQEGTVDEALKIMKLGVFDYLTKPIKPNDFLNTVTGALSGNSTANTTIHLPLHLKHRLRHGLIAESPQMRKVCELIEMVALAEVPVMLTGKKGAEIRKVAEVLHQRSGYTTAEALVADGASLKMEDLLGSEKRGLLKSGGSIGLLEKAEGGLLLIENTDQLSQELQEKLYDIICNGTFAKVGSSDEVEVKARLVFATHETDLERLKNKGICRTDFIDRIRQLAIYVPNLEERKEDILPLLHYYHVEELKRDPDLSITREVAGILEAYAWPEGMAEIRSIAEECFDTGETVTRMDLPKRILDNAVRKLDNSGSQRESMQLSCLKKFLHAYQAECLDKITAA